MKIDDFKNKKILILGFGREGADNFIYFRKRYPKKILGIGDRLEYQKLNIKYQKLIKQDKNIKLHLGKNYQKALKDYDVIIKSPGIPRGTIEPYITKNQKITSQTEIFLEKCSEEIIGVTGTKGKSTASSLIYDVLRSGHKKVYLIGNIEKPVFSFLEKAKRGDIFVYELSSHQLQSVKKSPHIAVFLNIYPEHLDYYRNFSEYLKAKQNITRYQGTQDYFIYNSSEKFVTETSEKTKAKKISFALEGADCSIKDGWIIYKKKKIMNVKSSPLPGSFNLLNIMPAIIIGTLFGISSSVINRAVVKFKPLKYRLEKIGIFKGVSFYNDALATIPEATIAAIDALGENVQTIILGGFDRNIDFKKLARRILNSRIRNMILFPATGEKIQNEVSGLAKKESFEEIPRSFDVDNMEDAVKICYKYTDRGKICLLSCASSSFSIFKDYRDKGDLFRKYVFKLGKNR